MLVWVNDSYRCNSKKLKVLKIKVLSGGWLNRVIYTQLKGQQKGEIKK